MKRNILIASAITLSFVMLQACNDGGTSKEASSTTMHHDDSSTAPHDHDGQGSTEHDPMMKKMKSDMEAMKMTGDFDVDFASMMMYHHQSAIDMSEMYLPKAKDEKMKLMATNIITAQKKEIAELKNMIANHKTKEKIQQHNDAGHSDGDHNELMMAMNTMMDKMKAMKMTGDADKDFAMMMIPHHEAAVDMAENEISHGQHIEMKKFAQKVIDDQSKEIKEFQDWLKK